MTEYKDGIYFEIFVVKNGVRYNAKIIDMADASKILVKSVVDGLGSLIDFEEMKQEVERYYDVDKDAGL